MRIQHIAHLLTAEEAFWLNPSERWELVEGRIVEVSPVKSRHGKILTRLAHRVNEYVEANRLVKSIAATSASSSGAILTPSGRRTSPSLAWDVCQSWRKRRFQKWFRIWLPRFCRPPIAGPLSNEKYPSTLAAGVRVVWIFDPSLGEARIYRPGMPSRKRSREPRRWLRPICFLGFGSR